MPTIDKRIDAYIAKSQEFAKPILEYLRDVVHEACPEVEETIKWGMPFFVYKGTIGGMAAFKAYATFGFPKASLMNDSEGIFEADSAMGHLGQITKKSDLPNKRTLIRYIKQAVAINEAGLKVKRPKSAQKPEPPIPPQFKKALAAKKPAAEQFKAFTSAKRREYIDWINEAKTEATRTKRIETATDWISEGKSRNWKYERK